MKKTTSRNNKSKGNMGSPKTSDDHRPREAPTEKSKSSVKINGSVGKHEVLIVPSSRSESQESEERSKKKGVVPKRQQASNGNPSSCSKKQRRKNEEEDEDDEEEVEEEQSKLNVIPMNRVQKIVKSEGPDLRMNNDAYFLINKATEKFIGQFCEDAFTSAAARDRKRFFKYSHLCKWIRGSTYSRDEECEQSCRDIPCEASIVAKERRYGFLSDFVPEKIKAEDALKEITHEET